MLLLHPPEKVKSNTRSIGAHDIIAKLIDKVLSSGPFLAFVPPVRAFQPKSLVLIRTAAANIGEGSAVVLAKENISLLTIPVHCE